VAGRITAYGRHQGDLFGIPATGRDIRVSGIAIWRIRGDRIVEHWHETDQMGLMQQLGVIPTTSPPEQGPTLPTTGRTASRRL